MPTRRALTLLRPLLARPAQSWRASATCGGRSPPPPCPPCEAPPPPPCRACPQRPLRARRVVCCPPPQGAAPPCPPPPPVCAQNCENYIRRKPASSPPSAPPQCTTARDHVSERLHCFDEHRRRRYEAAAAERAARPAPSAPAPRCPLSKPESLALATDGRRYAVSADAPAPRCAPRDPCSRPDPCGCPRSAHPPPQPVTLTPLTAGDCRPKERPRLDPCEHAPRTLLSIDRSSSSPPAADAVPCSAKRPEPKCPGPQAPKSQTAERSAAGYKSITSRIMNSLKSGCGPAGQTGKACQIGKVGKVPRWCANPPPTAPAPPHCRPPTLVERMGRCCPKSGPRPGTRRLHTATVVAAAAAPKTSGREATLAASEKLAAALKDREQLSEAGRGRCVRSPSCCPPAPPPPPPPPPPTTGGEIELGVPPGVDIVRVCVSMGKATIPAPCPPGKPDTKTGPPRKPETKTCPPSSTGSPRPAQPACSDSWLSIKKLQKKISSTCGRSEPPAPAKPPAGPCGTAKPPAPRAGPSGVCSPQGRVKMADVLPHTIFVKS